MSHSEKKMTLALLVGLAATVAVLFLLSTLGARAAMLTVNSSADSGPGNLLSAAHRPSASRSSLCATTDFTYPLTITLAISDTFGPRLLQPGGYSRYDFHRGLDWHAPLSTSVRAVTTGTVRSLRNNWEPSMGAGSGNFVHLLHEDIGCETRYNHLSAVHTAITDGLQVTPGQIIGWVGDTGSMYPHLHFEVRQGLTVTQRAAIHPLSTPFLPEWTNAATPTVTLRSVYTDATGLTALVQVTSLYTEPDVTTVSVTVSGAVADGRTIDYVDLNANTTVVADLDDPLVNDVCIIPADLNKENGYLVTMACRRLSHSPMATVTAQVADVGGRSSTATTSLTGGLQVAPPEQVAWGTPGQTVTFVYTLTNHGAGDTFTLTHLSAQGWPAVVTPMTATLGNGNDASITVTVEITVNTDRFGPPDCGLLVAEVYSGTQWVAAGFYRIYRDTYVSAETGGDHPGCGAQADPCASISCGIGRTDAGGTVHVARGTYTENLVLTRTIDLLGGYALDWTRSLTAYETIVNGDGQDTVLLIDGDYGPLVEGFTFFNGHRHGGAGGGVRLVGGAAPTLRSNWIISNAADLSGGGIYVGSYGTLTPTIVNNIIVSNASGSPSGGGGGIYVTDRPALIQGNVISGNQATHDGAGIYLTGDTTARVLGNHILGNEADDYGGGVLIRSSGVYLANNVVADNQAGDKGSGLSIMGSSPRLLHTTIARNSGGDGSGVYITDASSLYSAVALTNTILVSHTVGITVRAGNTAILNGVLWYGNSANASGPGTIIVTNEYTGSPAFVDPDARDYHIGVTSAARDRGTSTGVLVDIDGDYRMDTPDIGADEYFAPGVLLAPDRRVSVDPGTLVIYTHTLTNTGNGTDMFSITHHSSQSWSVQYDTPVSVGYGQTTTVVVNVTVPPGIISGTVDSTVIIATSQADNGIWASVIDTTTVRHVPNVALTPDHTGIANPGSVITYTHTLTNTGNGPDTFALTHESSRDWTIQYALTVTVGYNHTATIVVSVIVPSNSSGLTDTTVITATSQANTSVYATVADTTTVNMEIEPPPDPPTLLSPPNNAVTTTRAITFTWMPKTTGAAPTGYNLKLDGAAFTTTATTWPTILSTGHHTWTVRAYNAAGYSDWADAWTVEVVLHRIYLPVVLRDD